jgi:hypothetical protein
LCKCTKYNTMKNLFLISLFVAIAVFSTSCRKRKHCIDPANPECPNYDPCYLKTDVNADFEALFMLRGSPNYFELEVDVDTTQLHSYLTFKAKNSTFVTYKWVVGSDPKIYDKSSFELGFHLQSEESIPVTLIVEGSPDRHCNNKSDWRDTLTKIIHFRHYKNHALVGEYSGALTNNQNDKFNVRIMPGHGRFDGEINGRYQYIIGLPTIVANENEPIYFADTAIVHNGFSNTVAVFYNQNKNQPEVLAKLDQKTGNITIEYMVLDPWPPVNNKLIKKKYVFKGTKIK